MKHGRPGAQGRDGGRAPALLALPQLARTLPALALALPLLAWHPAALSAAGVASAAEQAGMPRAAAPSPPAPRPPAASEAELRQAERAARAALQQWQARLREVEDAAWAAQAPARAADRYSQLQQQALQAAETARRALAPVQACQAELPGLAQALQSAAAAFDDAVAGTTGAASGLAQADAAALREQVPAAQRAFAARRLAEQALQRSAQALYGQARSCGQGAASAQRAVERAHRATLALGEAAAALPATHATLRQALDYAATLGGAAAPPGPPLPRLLPPSLPGDGTARQLAAAVAPLPALPAAPGDDSPWALLQAAAAQQRQGLATLARQTDAAALLGVLADTPPDDCAPVGCPSFDADRSALARGRAGTRAALTEAQRRQAAAVAALGAALQPLQSAQNAIEAAQQALVAPAEAALADARSASQRAEAALAPLAQVTRQATASAQQAWAEAAARLDDGARLAGAAPPPPAPAAARPSPPLAMAMPPELRSHAHTTFTTLGGEPQGYGAYTYVLMSSAAALDNRDVKRRLLRVVSTLQQTSAKSALVSAAQRPRVNLFCIPSAADEDAPAGVMVDRYLGDLGQQALFQTQNALLTHGDLARRLSASPGPFLLTLPKRIHESAPDTPLLLADLSRYEEAAIADLVVAYMDGVLDDFPQRQAQWKPALPLSVGLTLVRWVSAPARIVSSLMPPAAARTERP